VLVILQFVVNTAAIILATALLLRFWMQALRVRPPAQVGHFVYTVSDWVVLPLRRIVPGVGGYDWASLLGTLLVVMLASTLYFLLLPGLSGSQMLGLGLHRFLTWMVYGLLGLLFLEVIFSWINPHAPLAPFVRALNEPLLRPLRRIVPPLGGLDLTVMILILILWVAIYLFDVIFIAAGVPVGYPGR
jgi:YggT family protein